MTFYKNIVSHYDSIFPLNSNQVTFVESGFRVMEGIRVLDLGCGTGSLAIMLGRHGAAVRGIDLDGQMIAAAKEKKPQALNVQFKVANMLNVADANIGAGFDVVLTFGNTLVHLNDENEVEAVIKQAKRILKPTGKLMIQIINYDRIDSVSMVELPLIENSAVIFQRKYVNKAGAKVEFKSVLTIKESNESYTQSVLLLSHTKERLENILKKYFNELKWWGSFKKEEWTVNSFHTIVEARNV